MLGDSTHAGPGESPRPQRSENPYAELQAHLEDLEHFSHLALQQFPRAERFLLCAQIRESLLQIQRLSVVAWKRYHKKSTLQDLDVEVEVLRKWITKSLRLGYITPKKHGTWLEIVNTIGLRLNPKTSIRPAHAGIDFAGYRIWATHILPRKRNVVRARKMLRRTRAQYATGALDFATARARLMSYLAYAKHCNAHNTTQAILDELVLIRRHPEPHP